MIAATLVVVGSGTSFGQTITGDLDGNHEVSLSDVTGFVGCLSGPESPSVDLLCVPALFDADDDVDLHDVAGFQNRFGFGVGPPRIDRFWPSPGTWIVNDIGLTHAQIGFSEPVVVPDGSVLVWGVGEGTISGFTTSYDPDAFVLTVTFATPLRRDRVTIVVDYTIEDLAGNPLDGEIYDPQNAVLPSGNGVNGGQGVFRVNVLKGDVNRDGVTDATDLDLISAALGSCKGDSGFDENADLNADGCVDDLDAAITTGALGAELPNTDQIPPTVVSVIVYGAFEHSHEIDVKFSESLRVELVSFRTCFLVGPTGDVVTPVAFYTLPLGNAGVFVFPSTMASCLGYTINVSNAVADSFGELLPQPVVEDCP